MDIGSFYLSFLIGTIGLGYVIYGKKVSSIVMILSGIGMMVYPYFVANIWISLVVGLVLVCLPFILSR